MLAHGRGDELKKLRWGRVTNMAVHGTAGTVANKRGNPRKFCLGYRQAHARVVDRRARCDHSSNLLFELVSKPRDNQYDDLGLTCDVSYRHVVDQTVHRGMMAQMMTGR